MLKKSTLSPVTQERGVGSKTTPGGKWFPQSGHNARGPATSDTRASSDQPTFKGQIIINKFPLSTFMSLYHELWSSSRDTDAHMFLFSVKTVIVIIGA